jgi:hypothetical protein
MQSLTSKGNHFKFIMLPLAIILLITLDISDMVNEILQINLETKPEFADVDCFNGRETSSSASYFAQWWLCSTDGLE